MQNALKSVTPIQATYDADAKQREENLSTLLGKDTPKKHTADFPSHPKTNPLSAELFRCSILQFFFENKILISVSISLV